ncbi:MAG TPA: hypothetical protein VG940_08815, partial [Gemmatimonadales bacterium]|nr:hypothetical protein [Gemmatimonadales bacterium]
MKSFVLLLGLTLAIRPVAAQTDYRDLDAERPLVTEDAYAIERGALEFTLAGASTVAGATDPSGTLVPELGLGLDNAQLSLAWPLARFVGGSYRSLGPRVGVLVNPFTQSRRWPALGFRLDAAAIEGTDGALDGRLTGKVIATRAFGATRMHLNASFTAGPEAPKYDEEFPSRAAASIALDR